MLHNWNSINICKIILFIFIIIYKCILIKVWSVCKQPALVFCVLKLFSIMFIMNNNKNTEIVVAKYFMHFLNWLIWLIIKLPKNINYRVLSPKELLLLFYITKYLLYILIWLYVCTYVYVCVYVYVCIIYII